MSDINKTSPEENVYHTPPEITKTVSPSQALTPAQMKVKAEVKRSYILIGIGSVSYFAIMIFIMAASELPISERIDLLLKYIFPVAAASVGYAVGKR